LALDSNDDSACCLLLRVADELLVFNELYSTYTDNMKHTDNMRHTDRVRDTQTE